MRRCLVCGMAKDHPVHGRHDKGQFSMPIGEVQVFFHRFDPGERRSRERRRI